MKEPHHPKEKEDKMNKDSTFPKIPESVPGVGDIYRTVTTFGKSFELRYGYYEDIDVGGEPDIIYPDFQGSPVYTDSGEPFVTMMQDACGLFRGKLPRGEDSTCAECDSFCRGEEFFGICKHSMNRKNE